MSELEAQYRVRYERLLRIASALEGQLSDHLQGMANIDRIGVRAKAVASFLAKAQRTNADGEPRYKRPLTEIQDQVGARVIVYYRDVVDVVTTEVMRYFKPIESKELVPESVWEFGYFGQHFVLALPADAIPKDNDEATAPRFFELQVKTLFQHAWSEANHELGYKAPIELSSDQQRRLAFTAAQAWGADHIFLELRRELAE